MIAFGSAIISLGLARGLRLEADVVQDEETVLQVCNMFEETSQCLSVKFEQTSNSLGEFSPTTQGCSVVQYAFGGYLHEGLKASAYIRSLKVPKGWCPYEPELDHVPVSLFTDAAGGRQLLSNFRSSDRIQPETEGALVRVLPEPFSEHANGVKCPPGVECYPLNELPAYPRHDNRTNLGMRATWKYRWYHAQVILKSPYTLTFYLDVDAVPCSGEGIAHLASRMYHEKADVGTTIHTLSCEMSPDKTCSSHNPGGSQREWSKFYERNAGVIVVNMAEGSKGQTIIRDFANEIVAWAGRAHGDQFAFRRAMFTHRHKATELVWSNDEVCRYKPEGQVLHKGDACKKGCQSIAHLWNGASLKFLPRLTHKNNNSWVNKHITSY